MEDKSPGSPADVSSSVPDSDDLPEPNEQSFNLQSLLFCGICKKSFASSANYNAHARTHSGIIHKCNWCSKLFPTKQSLKHHESEHSGMYRYSCDECDLGFNEKRLFVEHMKSHMPLH